MAVAGGTIDHEQSKVLLLVHPDTAAARQSVQTVIEAYRKNFEQQSVLWESAASASQREYPARCPEGGLPPLDPLEGRRGRFMTRI